MNFFSIRGPSTETLFVETKFVRLSHPVEVGDWIDGWRVCWVGGWDRGKILFVVIVERVIRRYQPPRLK